MYAATITATRDAGALSTTSSNPAVATISPNHWPSLVTLGEILDFEELSQDCAADGVWEFFFCCPPLKFTRAVGSPINPLAIK